MKIFLKNLFKDVILLPITSIFPSLIFAFFAWFFITVLAGKEITFLEYWRTTFIWTFCIGASLYAISYVLSFIQMIRYHRKFSVKLNDIAEGLFDFKLRESRGWTNWTAEGYQRWLQSKRLGRKFAEVIAEVLS